MTMNDTWGYKQDDQHWKSAAGLIRNLVDIVSKGGNYLLNVGPTSEGQIPEPSVERLQAVGQWMKVNGDAIYGTTATPFKRLPWGRCTTRQTPAGTVLYLHVFDWPDNGQLLVPGLMNAVASAQLLADGRGLTVSTNADGVLISLPAMAPDPISSTVILNILGTPEVRDTPITADTDGSVRFPAGEAVLQGKLQCESLGGKENIGFWTDSADTVSWTFRLDHAGTYQVKSELATPAVTRFEISVGDQKLVITSPVTKDYTKFKQVLLDGGLRLPAGKLTLTIRPVADGWQPFNLRSITLRPTD